MNAVPDGTAAHDLAAVHPSLHNMHVLKHKDMFAVFHATGDIPYESDTPAGLFGDDTRILSGWRFALQGARLKFLSGGVDKNGLVMASHIANYAFSDLKGQAVPEDTISLHRDKFIHDETLYEKIVVANHGLLPVSVKAILRFGSDFKDIFEVRGMQRSKKGVHLDTACGIDSCVTTYQGLDNRKRYCQIGFSRRPDFMELNEAVFQLRLSPKEEWELICRVSGRGDSLPAHGYAKALALAKSEMEKKQESWINVRTDNELFNLWLESSSKAVSLLVTELKSGPYPYAGIPWFSVPFGRDGIITALQVLNFNPDIARGVLQYLADHQASSYDGLSEAQPGRIIHEMRKSEMSYTGEVAFRQYYGSVDSTPLFILLAGAYYRTNEDKDFVLGLLPALRAALQWLDGDGDPDGDGFIEYCKQSDKGLATQGWKDSYDSVFHENGALAKGPIALCEVQGYVYAAYRTMAAFLKIAGEDEEAARVKEKAITLYQKFNKDFWDEEMGCYVMALDRDKKPCRVRSSNVGHLLFCDIVPEERAEKVVKMLMGPDFFTGWGIRTVGRQEARYSPLSYHNGSVWPHDTSIIAGGFARYGYYDEAVCILKALFLSAQSVDRMLLPELFCGYQKIYDEGVVRYPTACLPQAWSSAAGFMALSAALGLTSRNGELHVARAKGIEGLFGALEFWRDGQKIFSL